LASVKAQYAASITAEPVRHDCPLLHFSQV